MKIFQIQKTLILFFVLFIFNFGYGQYLRIEMCWAAIKLKVMSFNIKLILIIIFCIGFTENAKAQEYSYWVGFTHNCETCDLKPKKYVAYVSQIVMKPKGEYGSNVLNDFRNKYWPIVKKQTNSNTKAFVTSNEFYIHRENKETILSERKKFIENLTSRGGYTIYDAEKDNNKAKLTTTETYFTNLKIDDDLYIDGTVVIKSKFVFFGYPHIVAEYQNLKITEIRYKGDAFSLNSNKANKFISLPYQPKSKPHIDADFWVWTPKIINPKPTQKEHYRIFNYPIKRLVSITDNFDNDEIDAYFKGFKHQEKSDSFFWEKSLLQNPKQSSIATYDLAPIKITNLKGAFVLDIKNKLDKYYHDKNYDFWGNKKNKNKSKKEKKDDFWNN